MPIWRLPSPEALYSILAAYDSMVVVLIEVESRRASFTHIGPYQHLKMIDEGLVYALRWLADGRPFDSIQPTDAAASIDMAGRLLQHAAEYALVAMFHVLYSRGGIGVHADEAKRVVRFEPQDLGRHPWHTFADRFSVYDRRRPVSASIFAALHNYISRVAYDRVSGRIVLRQPLALVDPGVRTFATLAIPHEPLPLADDTDLVGFSLGQFRAFWISLFSWSQVLIALFLDLVYKHREQQSTCMPTQVLPLSDFVTVMATISGLAPSVVERIVERLSYDPTLPKADIFLNPLVRLGPIVSWSPLSVTLSRAERNLLKAMARRPELKHHADTVIGRREKPLLRELGLLLAQRGAYSYKLFTNVSIGGESGEIDLLASTRRAPNEILIVEGKAVLAVGDVSEGLGATAELLHAQHQVHAAIRLLQKLPSEHRRALYPFVKWEHVAAFRPLIVTPDSPLGHAVDESITPVVTLDSFKAHVRRKSYKSPTTLCQVCRDKPWLARFSAGPLSYEPVTIGDVTYELPFVGE